MKLVIKQLVGRSRDGTDRFADVGTPKVLVARDLDAARAQAKELVQKTGMVLRSLSITTDRDFIAIVEAERPQAKRDPHWVWKRPPTT